MALTRFLFPICLVFLSLLLINVSATDYGYGPKPPQVEKPTAPQVEKPEPPQVEKPKLDQLYGNLPSQNLFGIQGLVLCNSGLKAFPIQGNLASSNSILAIQCIF